MHLKLSLPGQARHWRWVLLGLLLLATLLFPATREAHVLTVRLLFHLNGKTIVQGQPSGCTIYVVPNVKFSDGYIAELRARSGRSLDDYALALGDLRHAGLEVPPIDAAWTNHPLMNWAAFQLTRNVILSARSVSDTNGVVTNLAAIQLEVDLARKAVHVARSASPTNGAWWLLEARLSFIEGNDAAAMTNLQQAIANPAWDMSLEKSRKHLTEVYRAAGLSNLDATRAASNLSPDFAALEIQGENKRALLQLIQTTVQRSDDQEFAELFAVLTGLNSCDWLEQGRFAQNRFRTFRFISDKWVDAMAQRLGRAPLPEQTSENYQERRELKRKIVDEFLTAHAEPAAFARFQGQLEVHRTEDLLRGELVSMKHRSGMWSALVGWLAGILSLLWLGVMSTVVLVELPFAWLMRKSQPNRKVPRHPGFWVLVALTLLLSIMVGASALLSTGIFNQTGFGPPEPAPPLSPMAQMCLLAAFMWLGCFLARLGAWQTPAPTRYIVSALEAGCLVYLPLIVFMALSRTAMAGHIMSPWW